VICTKGELPVYHTQQQAKITAVVFLSRCTWKHSPLFRFLCLSS